MIEEERDSKHSLRKFSMKVLKAAVKALIFYGIYFILSTVLSPFLEMLPSFRQIIETFVIVYIMLMIIGELTAGTIFHYFFNASRALFVILYMVFSLKGGIIEVTLQNIHLAADLRLFLMVIMLLGLLGFAKSVLQGIEFLNKKTGQNLIGTRTM